MLRALSLLVLAAALCACGAPLTKNDAAPPTRGDSYYVFGLKPANYKVQIFPGSLDAEGKFKLNPFLNAAFNSVADQGYAVGKAKAGSVLAITRVYVKGDGLIDPSFVPCGEAQTLVFTAGDQQIAYLGDIEYRFDGNKLEVARGSDIESARKYLQANYPKLAPSLQQAEPRLAKTDLSCSQTIYVPVYLPR
jgi:hypothetical protein